MKKATYLNIDKEYLESRTSIKYGKAKWIIFSENLLDKGYNIKLYEARRTVSKYLYIEKNKKIFKVRFSNHKPVRAKEAKKDCDFFVGVTNLGVTNTEDALQAVENFFKN